MRSRVVVLITSLLAAVLGWPAGHGAPQSSAQSVSRPNIVVVMVDDMRADDLAFMPQVQRLLVDRGLSFTNFYAPLAWCCPSRASFLTGQYPHNHRVLTNKPPLGGFPALRDGQTLATWLQPAYQTGFVGKYFNAYGPVTDSSTYVPPGWDNWEASLGRHSYDYLGLRLNINGQLRRFNGSYATDVVASRSHRFIRRSARSERPFFLWSSFVAPHSGEPSDADDKMYPTPYVAPAYRDTYTGPAVPAQASFNEADVSDKPKFIQEQPRLTRRQVAGVAEAMAQRRESLRSVDDAVARLVATLRRNHELGNTLLLFVSDNGYFLGEHRIPSGKVLPYEPVARLPLVIRGPGVPSGERRHGVFTMPDVAPTILALAGQSERPRIRLDGRSMRPAFSNPGMARRRAVLLEGVVAHVVSDQRVETHSYRTKASLPGDDDRTDEVLWRYRGVVARRWKLVRWPQTKEVELYDLRRDPHERHNVASEPGNAGTVKELSRRLRELRACSGSECRG